MRAAPVPPLLYEPVVLSLKSPELAAVTVPQKHSVPLAASTRALADSKKER